MRFSIIAVSLFVAVFAACCFIFPPHQSIHALGGQPAYQGTAGSPSKFLIEVSKGNVPGHSIIHKFGHGDVGTSMVPVTNSLVYQTPTTAVALEVVSADADDTAAGAGAQAVTIIGLALNGSVVTQVVELNGLTAVAIPTSLWRVYRWYVSRSGVYATPLVGSHQGILTIRVAAAGATWSTIPFAPYPHGQSEIAWYSVAEGTTAYLLSATITVDSTKSVDILGIRRENADDVTTPFASSRIFASAHGITEEVNLLPIRSALNGFEEMSDFGFLGMVASGTAEVAVHMEILLIQDGY